MKALILAAGLGTRLAPITNDRPKCLVPVNGTPIIIKQIENLYQNCITDITVISGYKAEVLEKEIHAFFPDINIINSVNYQETNNMFSSYLAKDVMKNKDFLMMNADVFFDASIIKSLIECPYSNAIVTDIGSYNNESMKVVEENDRIVKISKQISKEDALGNSIDVYKFSKEAGALYFDTCKDYIERKHEMKLWSEVALNDILIKLKFGVCALNGRWVEIDNHEDLALAEKLFSD